MIRLSKLTDYAVVLLSQMAAQPDKRFASSQLAHVTGVPEPTVAKILKQLAQAELVSSARGVQGGYQLAHAARDVTIRAVIEALEGKIAITDCASDEQGTCGTHKCPTRGQWSKVNEAIIGALDAIKLTDMMKPNLVRVIDAVE